MVQRGGEPGGEEFGDADWLLGQLGDGEADAADAADESRRQGRRAAAPAPSEPAAEPEFGAPAEPPVTPPAAGATPSPGSPAEPVGSDASAPRTPWWTSRSRGRRAAEPETDGGAGSGAVPSTPASPLPTADSEAPRDEPSGRRRAGSPGEESLDWFSLAAQAPQAPQQAEPPQPAEPPQAPEAEGAAAPMTTPAVPISDEPRSERGDTGVLDEPLLRRRDRGPAVPPADPILTAVEPPVAPQRAPQPPAAAGAPAPEPPRSETRAEPWAPATPAVPAEPQTPVVPGPATPTAPFALTWGDPAAAAGAVPNEPSTPVPGAAEHETGAFGEPLVPPPVSAAAASASAAATTDFDAALWSALQEGDTGEAPTLSPDAHVADAHVTDARVTDADAAAAAGAVPPARTPFPAFASGSTAPVEPAVEAPVDDLLAGVASGAAVGAAATPSETAQTPDIEAPTEPEPSTDAERDPLGLGFGAGAASAFDAAAAQREPDDLDDDETDAPEDAAFVWGIVPDPEAADPRAEDGPLGTVALAAVAAEGETPADGALHDEQPESAPPTAADPAETLDPADTLDPFGFGPEASAFAEPRAGDAEPSAATALLPVAGTAAAAGAAGHAGGAGRTPAGDAGRFASESRAQRADAPGPGSRGGSGAGSGAGAGGAGGGSRRRILLWIAGGLVAVLVLGGLFLLGTKLPFGAQPAASGPATSDSAAPSDTPAPAPTAAQPAGVHAWNTLFGGECIDPFTDAWAQDYTVVDCAAPHAAQLVLRGTLPGEAGAAFPGDAELAAQLGTACQADGVLDGNAIAGLSDLQLVFSYPLAEQWDAGERTFYCFANRSSGEPLTGSIAGATPSQVAAG